MIGYMFMGQDKARLIERECEYTAQMLGADAHTMGAQCPQHIRITESQRAGFERRFGLFRRYIE